MRALATLAAGLAVTLALAAPAAAQTYTPCAGRAPAVNWQTESQGNGLYRYSVHVRLQTRLFMRGTFNAANTVQDGALNTPVDRRPGFHQIRLGTGSVNLGPDALRQATTLLCINA